MSERLDENDQIAEWLGDMPEAYNVTDYADEQTTVITIDVDALAARVAERFPPIAPVTSRGVAWEDRLNIICICGTVCSGVIRKNPAGGFIGSPGSDTYVDPPAAQVFANHLWEMSHPPVVTPSAGGGA